MKQERKNLVSTVKIENRIYQMRGKKVMLDRDLAELYGVATKQLTRQVRRNIRRFPDDFMFRSTEQEILRCQFGTSSLRSQNMISKEEVIGFRFRFRPGNVYRLSMKKVTYEFRTKN